MRRRPLLWFGSLLAIGLVFVLAFPTSQYVLIGLLQNEAFYDGKPTNYWVSALKKRGYFGSEGPPRDVGHILSKAGAAAVPVLVDMLQEEDDDVRFHALLALFAMKPGEAAAATPALARAMINEKTVFHRNLAHWALVKADEEGAIRAFIGMLEHREKNRVLAADALGALGPRARAAVEALRVALDDKDRKVRVAAAQALWRVERRADWKAGHVASSRHGIPVVAPKSILQIEAVSSRLKGELIHPNRTSILGGIQFSPDGKRILAGDSPGGVVAVWDVEGGHQITRIETGYGYRLSAENFFVSPDWQTLLASHAGKADFEQFEKDGKRLFRWKFDGAVRDWDLSTGQLRRTFQHQPARDATLSGWEKVCHV